MGEHVLKGVEDRLNGQTLEPGSSLERFLLASQGMTVTQETALKGKATQERASDAEYWAQKFDE